jgi:hypothetical protein
MSALEVVAEHLTALGLRFRRTEDQDILIEFSGDNTPYTAVIQARGPIVAVTAYTVSMVPSPRLDETIRVANMLNATRVMFGGFWVDAGRMRVAFELSIAAPDGPTRSQIDLGMAALSQIDTCFPILAAVIWGGKTAEVALLAASTNEQQEEPPALDMAV